MTNYYEKISEHISPFITDRPLTLFRCPTPNKCFLQNHWMHDMSDSLQAIKILDKYEPNEYVSLIKKQGTTIVSAIISIRNTFLGESQC